ncbi:response regulator transcription factor [Cupriavidus numazuensis]|uniref:Transcriptional regulatory protein RcsB n=1 Tax=Cupriavidus numazuensis TaxID=221992 RepID=A0ABM8TP92_9BURK|nr:response regulator transcription factor [Cupriavidus numazuensis]CAG2156858.1 Transcriptional regulatory protein RcsB [Cupriavidus numazuensis]
MIIRVMLADDHPLILVGARHVLSTELGFTIVGEAQSADSLMDMLETTSCDVLVTDFSMPSERNADGLAMLGAIRRRFSQVRIVVLTMLDNAALLQSMRDAGALGVLNKRGDMAELPSAIVTAFQGRPFLGKSVQREMEALGINRPATTPAQVLSPREIEVVRLYAGGMSVSAVAQHLHRSIKTISTHKHSAMEKLGIRSDAELYQYAVQNGLM